VPNLPVSHSEERFIDAGNLRFCYDSFGDAADPPLVLIMGLAAQLVLWDDDFCALLAAQGRYVVRFDNRDIGRSSYLDHLPTPNLTLGFLAQFLRRKYSAPYTLVDMARDTIAFIDALGLDKVDVVGASMGGAIVQELAILTPERFRTIPMIMASSGDPNLALPTIAAFRALMAKPPRDKEAYLTYYATFWTALSGREYAIDPARTRHQGELCYERGNHPAGAARQFGAILASGNRKSKLRGVRSRTLVIHGLSDPLIPPSHGRDLAHTVPGATLKLIEGMGHALPEKCWPDIVAAIGAHAPVPTTA